MSRPRWLLPWMVASCAALGAALGLIDAARCAAGRCG